VPDAVHEKLRGVFPGAVVRNARLSSVEKPIPPKKKKETDTFEEPEKEIDDPELRSEFRTDPKQHLKDPGRYLRSAQWAQETFTAQTKGKSLSWKERALGWLRKDSATGADHDGAMVCLYIPDAVGEVLKVRGGEPTKDMHITLAYFVEKAADRDDWNKLIDVIETVARKHSALNGAVSGYGIFSNEVDVLYASADVPGINELQQDVTEAAEDAGFTVSKEHSFTPHITLKYDHKGKTPKADPLLVLKEICVVVADERTCFELSGSGIYKNFSSSLY
jgi:2'-5' RNA ligase